MLFEIYQDFIIYPVKLFAGRKIDPLGCHKCLRKDTAQKKFWIICRKLKDHQEVLILIIEIIMDF